MKQDEDLRMNETQTVRTWPGALESHTDVVYCLSNSGALSFWSSVSMATTTLDTRFGLSEGEESDTDDWLLHTPGGAL